MGLERIPIDLEHFPNSLKNVFQIEITNNHFTNTVVKLENFRAKLSSRNNYFKFRHNIAKIYILIEI